MQSYSIANGPHSVLTYTEMYISAAVVFAVEITKIFEIGLG